MNFDEMCDYLIAKGYYIPNYAVYLVITMAESEGYYRHYHDEDDFEGHSIYFTKSKGGE